MNSVRLFTYIVNCGHCLCSLNDERALYVIQSIVLKYRDHVVLFLIELSYVVYLSEVIHVLFFKKSFTVLNRHSFRDDCMTT